MSPLNLKGKVFGKLTVLKKSNNKSGSNIKWICRCDCGAIKEVAGSDLVAKRTLSCGCFGKQKRLEGIKAKVVSLSGRKFNRLLVLEETELREGHAILRRCLCDCGNITYATATELKKGLKKSCGCLQKQGNKEALILATSKLEFVRGTCINQIKSKKIYSTNTSGARGVFCDRGTWRAVITFKGKRFYLISTKDFNEACLVRKKAEEMIYGEFLEWYKSIHKQAEETKTNNPSQDDSNNKK